MRLSNRSPTEMRRRNETRKRETRFSVCRRRIETGETFASTASARGPPLHAIPGGCAMSGETSEGRPALKTRPVEKCLARKGHYKPIATEFKHDGFNYRQIAREGDVAIYEQRWRDSENVC